MPENISLLIFDLDGTLVDSKYDLADSVNFALDKQGRPPISYEQIPDMVGSGIQKLLESALGDHRPEELAEARREFDLHYSKNFTNKTKAYPGVPEILNHYAHKKKAVYSNKTHPYTVEIIRKLGLAGHFDLVQGARPNLYAAKPSPEGIKYILDHLGIDPNEALMVGDSTHDMHAAQAAGIATCAVTYGYRSRAILEQSRPDLLIDHMEDLQKHIG